MAEEANALGKADECADVGPVVGKVGLLVGVTGQERGDADECLVVAEKSAVLA